MFGSTALFVSVRLCVPTSVGFPGAPNTGNLYELSESELSSRGIHLLPMSLREALSNLEKDSVLRQALGTDFTSYYIQVKTEEWVQYQRSVSEWEIDRYLLTF